MCQIRETLNSPFCFKINPFQLFFETGTEHFRVPPRVTLMGGTLRHYINRAILLSCDYPLLDLHQRTLRWLIAHTEYFLPYCCLLSVYRYGHDMENKKQIKLFLELSKELPRLSYRTNGVIHSYILYRAR